MKPHIYNKVKFLSNSIPVSSYIAITNQKRILPFYHTITDKPKPHLKHLNYYRTEERFKEDLNFYLANYKSISLAEIKNTNDRVFHVNFDDGLSEVYETVIPLLLSNNVHGTFFINSDFIDNRKMFYKHRISLIIDVIK